MKRNICLGILFFCLVLSGCNLPDNNVDPNIIYTLSAATEQAKMNAIASLTPPTETPLPTETPTETPLPTNTPTPTIEPTPTWVMHAKGSAEVLILYYYDIANGTGDDPYYMWESASNVPSIEFEQQVRVLNEMGYESIGISQLVNVIRDGGELPGRPVMFTFDSTQLGQYKNAYPILKKYGFMGNLMLCSGHVDSQNELSSDQIKEMIAAGWEIGSAGYWGNGMTDTGTMGQEIGQSKPMLEKMFGVQVLAFAYPDGYIDPESKMIQRASEYGYYGAFGGDLRSTDINSNNLFLMPRYLIQKGETINAFMDILPWKEGNISKETMEWTIPTPTISPEDILATKAAADAALGAGATTSGAETGAASGTASAVASGEAAPGAETASGGAATQVVSGTEGGGTESGSDFVDVNYEE